MDTVDEINHGQLPTRLGGSDFLAGWVSPIPNEVLRDGGDWRPWATKPIFQHTKDGRDQMSCVAHGASDGLETLGQFKNLDVPRISRRAIAMLSGTMKYNGNTFQNVWNAFRRYGLIPEALWRDEESQTWEDYYDTNITPDALRAGAESLLKYDIGYEFIGYVSDATLLEGLKRGPIQISIGLDSLNLETHSVLLMNPKRWVMDSEIPGSTFLTPTRKIYGALRPYIGIKKPMPTTPNAPVLPERCLVTGVFEHELKTGYFKAGKMIIDDANELVRRWIAENEKDGMFGGGPVRTITAPEWDALPHTDLKGTKIA